MSVLGAALAFRTGEPFTTVGALFRRRSPRVTGGGEDPPVRVRPAGVPAQAEQPRPRAAEWSTGQKVLASLGLVAAWAGLTGLGMFGTLTDETASLDAPIRSGTVSLRSSAANVPLAVSGLLPGEQVFRAVDLTNDGDVPLSSVGLTSVATTASRLDTEDDGLQLTVRSCSVPWTDESVCAGEWRVLLPPGPVARRAVLEDPASLLPGGTDHLAVTVSLSGDAGNEFAGQRSAVHVTFTAVQRAGHAR